MKEWSELSLQEKISALPQRHPFVVKVMLYLAFNVCPVPWEFVYLVLERLGYVRIITRRELDIGEAVTLTWTQPDRSLLATYAEENEHLNTSNDI